MITHTHEDKSSGDKLKEKCAVVGIWNSKEASKDTYFGLFALQHRGQESTGMVTSNGSDFFVHKGAGLVSGVYTDEILSSLPGTAAIGHNRYSTSSGGGMQHAQPILPYERCQRTQESAQHSQESTPPSHATFALAHNGNIPSIEKMVQFLNKQGIETDECSDSVLMTRIIDVFVKKGNSVADAIKEMYSEVTGAFSCVVLTHDMLIAFRDPWGMRPLSFGRRRTQGIQGEEYTYIVASETCALDTLGAEYIRDVEPGEMVCITTGQDGFVRVDSVQISVGIQPKFDIFEFVYFARHDSVLLGQDVYEVRKRFGKLLAEERPLDVDIVIPVPETAVPAALGYSQASGIPLEFGLCKNRYIHRTFIQPTQNDRDTKVRMKLLPLKQTICGKRVAVIDDSIVRGTTSKRIVKMLFEAGATEVHFLVTSAPIRFPDFYGIDTPNQEDLIASSRTAEQVRQYLGATSLTYLTVENMVKATGLPADRFSLSSFTGEYPIPLFEKEQTFSRSVPYDQIRIESILDVQASEIFA